MLSDPFTHCSLLSRRSNLRLRPKNHPVSPPVGSIVVGGCDPAACHAR